MTGFVLDRSDLRLALSHLALYGLGAIVEEAGRPVRMHWTRGLNARPRLVCPDLEPAQLGAAVREHAARAAAAESWLSRDIDLEGAKRGLMSPRLTAISQRTWPLIQRARRSVLDELTDKRCLLDLRMLAALGEPAYWSFDSKGTIQQDHGASRWEMQPRNTGSEIVGSRLRKLAAAVAARSAAAVVEGLEGSRVVDEVGNDKPDSRTATGLSAPGPTDNALAWCALWGISQLPIAMRVSTARRPGVAVTAGHVGGSRHEWFYAPVWHDEWLPARLRTILGSGQLRTLARDGLPGEARLQPPVAAARAARAWLAARGVVGIVRFPVARFGSDNAPERRAMQGDLLAVEG